MDKTTTWLLRGASAIVIIFGISYFAKPQITKLINYVYEKKENKNVYKNTEWYKKYLKNPESYCEKLVRKNLNKNTRVLLAMNQDLQKNAEELFNYCEKEGGAEMPEVSRCLINAMYFDYSKKEINEFIKLYRLDNKAGNKFIGELYERNLISCDFAF